MKKFWVRMFRLSGRYLLAFVTVFIVLVMVAAGFIATIETQLPDVEVLKDVHMQVPLRVYSREGLLISEYGSSRLMPISLNEVPKPLIQAILSTEDQRFYSHPGVDFIGLFRAAKVVLGTGQKSQGASTITMQVARNFFLTHKKTYIRKIREILLALKIERSFSKDKILELYLNKVYFGNRAYGVAAAASVYYGKTLDQLTIAEMGMIAGLPQAPSKNNPIIRPKEAVQRRNHVLLRMLGTGAITRDQYRQAIVELDKASYHGPQLGVNAPYVGEMVRQFMVQQYGEQVYDKGYAVFTTISAPLQKAADRALQKGLIDYTHRHGYIPSRQRLSQSGSNWQDVWRKKLNQLSLYSNILHPAAILQVNSENLSAMLASGQTIYVKDNTKNLQTGEVIWVMEGNQGWSLESYPKVQGALVAMDPQTGGILALTGGFDYSASEFNRATQAARQPGSGFKPFIYSAALDKGYTLASTFNDAPIVIKDSGEEKIWRPQNSSKQFYGPTRLREALIQSRNMVSIRLLQEITVPYTIGFIERFGFDKKDLPETLSLALGTGLTSPLKITTGYSVFANGGYKITPYFIDKILTEDQQLVYAANPATACQSCLTSDSDQPLESGAPRVLDPQNAYLITHALQDVIVHGTGKAALVLNRSDLAGKTGTTNDEADAWFIGYNSRIVATVWVGFDDLSPTYEYGGGAALPVWIDFMRTALGAIPPSAMPQPPGIVTARIDPQTGLLALPGQANAMFEVFIQGKEPKEEAPVAQADSSTAPGEIF